MGSSRESSPEASLPLHTRALDISEQIEASMVAIGPCLCKLLLEHRGALSKLLLGTNGRALLTDGELPYSEKYPLSSFQVFKSSSDVFYFCSVVWTVSCDYSLI